MGENSGIQWTDHTFNPWRGCQRVSPGCEHCYAEALVTGRFKLPLWGPPKTTERKRTTVANWRTPLKWNAAAAKAGRRDRVFCASLADVFEDHPSLGPWRTDLFALIERTPHLDWQLLTKRPENLRTMLPPAWLETPRPNVWLGCTVEDQRRADERVPHLLSTPAAVRFLSCEPLLEAVNLEAYLVEPMRCRACRSWAIGYDANPHGLPVIHTCLLGAPLTGEPGAERCSACGSLDIEPMPRVSWVIVGGESGPGARPFDLAWGRSIVAQCRYAHVPVFVKQMGMNAIDSAGYDVMNASGGIAYSRHVGARDAASLRAEAERMGRTIRPRNVSRFLRDSHGGDPAEWPGDLRVREMPVAPT